MKSFLEVLYKNGKKFDKKKVIIFLLIPLILGLVFLLDRVLAIGLLFLVFLFAITFLIISKLGIVGRTLYLFILIIFLIRLGATLFIYYADFQPFSGGKGDYMYYDREAKIITQQLYEGQWDFFKFPWQYDPLYIPYYHTLIIGVIYFLTLPEILIGQLFGVWLSVITGLAAYLIVLELGASKKWAVIVCLIVSIYPSYLFYGSLLLKDTYIVTSAILGLLLAVKLLKHFSWWKFFFFYLILGELINFRFYIGYALLFTFIFCWFLISKFPLKKRIVYGIIIFFLLGFLPEIFANQGYYGIDSLKTYLNPEVIKYFREIAYVYQSPQSLQTLQPTQVVLPNQGALPPGHPLRGDGSTIVIKTKFDDPIGFLINYLKLFIYTLLGPFPWHLRYSRHLFVLTETIPWYFLIYFIGKGLINSIKKKNWIFLPLIIFSLGVLGIIALFIDNFGIITRLRMPVFISLLCIAPFGFQKREIQEKQKSNSYILKAPKVKIIQDRDEFILEKCKGKKVLHLGCVDEGFTEERLKQGSLLHLRLMNKAKTVWGIDISKKGIEILKERGVPNLVLGNVEHLDLLKYLQKEEFDMILASELIEHVNNPGLFLQSAKYLFSAETSMILTVPNAFRLNQFWYGLFGYECVHPDHNYWFSQRTLSALLKKNGYKIDEILTYKYSFARFGIKNLLNFFVNIPLYRLNPFFCDGLIFIVRPKEFAKE